MWLEVAKGEGNEYGRISFILARNWTCKDSLESSFNVECAHELM